MATEIVKDASESYCKGVFRVLRASGATQN